MAEQLRVGDLTRRQKEVADLLARGYSNGEIAERLGISLDGAKWHVRELIGKLGVESRDEVADAWERSRRRERWGWVPGWGGLLSLKVGAGVLGSAAAAGGVLIVASIGNGGDEPRVVDAVQAAATPTPVVTATAFPFPAAPGALFTPQEALDVALRQAEPYLRRLDETLAQPLQSADLQLSNVEWLPGISTFQSEDPDRYWDPGDGVARNVWRFQWTTGALRTKRTDLEPGPVKVDVLIEDGSTSEALAAQALFFAKDSDFPLGEGGGWHSRMRIEQHHRMHTAAGPGVKVAWLNAEPGGAYMELFPNLDGHWCERLVNGAGERIGNGGCHAPGAEPWEKLQVPLQFSYDPSTSTFGPAVLLIVAAQETVRLVVERSDGVVLEFPVDAPIDVVPVPARFAYLDIGPMPEWFTVRSFDADGNQLGEETLGTANFSPPPAPGRP